MEEMDNGEGIATDALGQEIGQTDERRCTDAWNSAYAKRASAAATIATAETPAAVTADEPDGVLGTFVWPGASVVGPAVDTMPTDCTVSASDDTVLYTLAMLFSHVLLAAAVCTVACSVAGDLPLPWYTPNTTTNEPTFSEKIAMNDEDTPRYPAMSLAMAVLAWAYSALLFSTDAQLLPEMRSVATMSVARDVGCGVVGTGAGVPLSRFAELQALDTIDEQLPVLPVWFVSWHALYVHDCDSADVLKAVPVIAAIIAMYTWLPNVEHPVSEVFWRAAVVVIRHEK